jgi:hypothetical protein
VYDKDKSGSLNAQELTKCIQVYSDSRHWTADPVIPTEEEVSLLLKGAGHHKQNSVDASEIEYALDLWHSYVSNREKIQAVFEKYDTDHSQKLEFDQLVLYLTDLNEGHKPKVSPEDHNTKSSLIFIHVVILYLLCSFLHLQGYICKSQYSCLALLCVRELSDFG